MAFFYYSQLVAAFCFRKGKKVVTTAQCCNLDEFEFNKLLLFGFSMEKFKISYHSLKDLIRRI